MLQVLGICQPQRDTPTSWLKRLASSCDIEGNGTGHETLGSKLFNCRMEWVHWRVTIPPPSFRTLVGGPARCWGAEVGAGLTIPNVIPYTRAG